MKLTIAEREAFLAEPHEAVLGVARSDKAMPLLVPLWYFYRPGDATAWILTGRDSVKARHIFAAGEFSLAVRATRPRVRYAVVEGPVVHTERGTREMLNTMASRYLPPERVAEYVDFAWTHHGEQVAFHLRLDTWRTSDMGEG